MEYKINYELSYAESEDGFQIMNYEKRDVPHLASVAQLKKDLGEVKCL